MRIITYVVAAVSSVALMATLVGCSAPASQGHNVASNETGPATQREAATQTMQVEVNGTAFTATFADTQAAEEFRAQLPLTVNATELNGNEKYAQLDESLSMNGASVVSPIESGDIFLYGGNDVVLFYQTHDNSSWSYVPIAHIDDPTGLAEAVGSGDVTITYE